MTPDFGARLPQPFGRDHLWLYTGDAEKLVHISASYLAGPSAFAVRRALKAFERHSVLSPNLREFVFAGTAVACPGH